MAECEHIASGQFPAPGVPGATFVPGVEEIPEGYEVSWENNRNLPNPDPVRLLHGKSAYQLAVEAGYEGTEVEFAAEMATAAVAKAKAEAAAEAAGKSEANAAGSADAAAQSEQNAKDSEEAAQQAAGEAEQLAQAAAGSAGAASLSEQNAAASEQAAEDAAEEAGNQAAAAGLSQQKAATSESNAKTSEENAAQSADEAKKAAQESQGVVISGTAQPGQLLLVESVSEDGKLLNCTAVDPTHGIATALVEVMAEKSIDFSDGINDPFVNAFSSLAEGATYVIIWDGTEYECVAEEVTVDGTTAVAMGNPVVMGGADNGLPFVIADIPGEYTMIMPVLDNNQGTHTVGFSEAKSVVKTIAPQFLPEGVPYKGEPVAVEVLPEQSVEFSNNQAVLPVIGLVTGTTYTVTVNGAEYECVAAELAEGGITGIWIGNPELLGIGADNGAPFFIADIPANGMCVAVTTAGDGTYTVSIKTVTENLKKLDNKYLDLDWLPTKTNHDVELVPEFTHVSEGTTTRPDWLKGSSDIDPYDTLVVVIDGVRYECKLRIIPYDSVNLWGRYWVAASPGTDKLNNPDYPFVLYGFTESESSPHFYVKEPGEYQVAIYGIARIPDKLPNEFLDLDWIPERIYEEGAEVIPRQVVSADSPQSGGGYFGKCTVENPSDTLLEEGKTYEVEWNGTKYFTVCTVLSSGTAMLGNGAIDGLDATPDGDTSCPFMIMSNSLGVSVLTATETLVTLRVIEKTKLPNPMPAEFMPESVDYLILNSSTEGSTKKFKVTVDDTGALTAAEVTT